MMEFYRASFFSSIFIISFSCLNVFSTLPSSGVQCLDDVRYRGDRLAVISNPKQTKEVAANKTPKAAAADFMQEPSYDVSRRLVSHKPELVAFVLRKCWSGSSLQLASVATSLHIVGHAVEYAQRLSLCNYFAYRELYE
jgi:hypothetical protein